MFILDSAGEESTLPRLLADRVRVEMSIRLQIYAFFDDCGQNLNNYAPNHPPFVFFFRLIWLRLYPKAIPSPKVFGCSLTGSRSNTQSSLFGEKIYLLGRRSISSQKKQSYRVRDCMSGNGGAGAKNAIATVNNALVLGRFVAITSQTQGIRLGYVLFGLSARKY